MPSGIQEQLSVSRSVSAAMNVGTQDRQQRVKFLAAWSALLLIKVALAALLPLFGDEAFYWWEGQHLAWAYSDLPGATAWLARLAVEVAGHNPLGLRWLFMALAAAAPWLLVRIAGRWFGADVGWRAGWLSLLLPLFAGIGLLALPDVLLTLATLLCLDAIAALLHRPPGAPSVPRGIDRLALLELAAGLMLGAFSHYRFVVVIAAGGLALLLMPRGRELLRRGPVWLAGIVGAAAWLPLLWWNWQQHGVGLSFQLLDRHPWRFSIEGAQFPLLQALIVSPALFAALLWTIPRLWRRWRHADPLADDRWGLIAVSALLPLLGFFVLGFFADRERFSLHWPLPAYLVLIPALALWWPELGRRVRLAVVALAVATQIAFVLWLLAAALPSLRANLTDSKLYPGAFAGWTEVAEAAEQALAHMPPDTQLVADNFMLGAELAFALHPRPVITLAHPHDVKHGRARQLELWGLRHQGLPSRPALVIVEDSLRPPRLRLAGHHELCRRTGGLRSPDVLNVDGGRKRFLSYRLLPGANEGCVLPAMGYIDFPAPGARVGAGFDVVGWAFKDGAGVARVVVLIDGVPVSSAEYGLPMPHVGEFWAISTDRAHPEVGFRARIDSSAVAPGQYRLSLRVHGKDGSVEDLPGQKLRIDRSN